MVIAAAHSAEPRPVSGRIGPTAGTLARVSGIATDPVQPPCLTPAASPFQIDAFGAAVFASEAKQSRVAPR
jgi:hypothetical protein